MIHKINTPNKVITTIVNTIKIKTRIDLFSKKQYSQNVLLSFNTHEILNKPTVYIMS